MTISDLMGALNPGSPDQKIYIAKRGKLYEPTWHNDGRCARTNRPQMYFSTRIIEHEIEADALVIEFGYE